jgi:hypothetical protein
MEMYLRKTCVIGEHPVQRPSSEQRPVIPESVYAVANSRHHYHF